MRLRIIAVGARQPAWVDAAVEEYLKRIRAPWRCELTLIEAAPRSATRSAEAARDKEGEKVLSAVKDRERLILLDETGKSFGGPDGHAPAVRARASDSWSLSPLTLPHGLARVMLVEQLYRAQSVLLGHPYHRE